MPFYPANLACIALTFGLISALCHAEDGPRDTTNNEITKILDIAYAMTDERELRLDLYLPKHVSHPPLAIWIHGGAWRRGTKEWRGQFYMIDPYFLADQGFAMASLDFRLSGEAKFPAQIHDIKAAIRYLRRNESEYKYDSSRIAILGASSGAHLATLVGVTNGNQQLEGQIGDADDESSDVQAIVSYFGASNLTSILNQSTPRGLQLRVPALGSFIGGQPDDLPEVARLASPVYHVDTSDPPLLWIHGDQDSQMPINQAHEIIGLYKQTGLKAEFEVVHGGVHGGEAFFDQRRNELVAEFLRRQLH